MQEDLSTNASPFDMKSSPFDMKLIPLGSNPLSKTNDKDPRRMEPEVGSADPTCRSADLPMGPIKLPFDSMTCGTPSRR